MKGFMAPTSQQSQVAPSPASREGSWDPGQPQMETSGRGPGSRGHGEAAAARVTWQRPGINCWPRGGSSSKLPGVSRMRTQDGCTLGSSFFLGQKNPMIRKEENTFAAA